MCDALVIVEHGLFDESSILDFDGPGLIWIYY